MVETSETFLRSNQIKSVASFFFKGCTAILLAGTLLTGCTVTSTGIRFDQSVPVEQGLRGTQFILPEANGKLLKGKAQLALQGGPYVQLINDIDSVSYSTDTKLNSGFEFNFLIDLGVFEKLDIYYSGGLGFKLQVYGANRQNPKAGGYSMGLAYHILNFDEAVTSEDSTGGIKRAKAKIYGDGHQYLVIVGYRKNESTLFYGGPFYSSVVIDRVHLFQTNNTNYSVDSDVTSGEGSSYGANLGVFHEKPKAFFGTLGASMGLEIAFSHSRWKKTNEPHNSNQLDAIHAGGIVGLTW